MGGEEVVDLLQWSEHLLREGGREGEKEAELLVGAGSDQRETREIRHPHTPTGHQEAAPDNARHINQLLQELLQWPEECKE
jgi:hypothetical protein